LPAGQQTSLPLVEVRRQHREHVRKCLLAHLHTVILHRASNLLTDPYEKFFANWGHVAGNPYIDLINAMPKYVASRSLTETSWNATLLGPDPSTEIAHLKNQPGKDLIKYGTSRFDDTLVRARLVDEFRFWIRPVVAGAGQRLFEDVDTSELNLKLTDEKRLENGSVILTYMPC
jgi:dihydrofolate reductase